MSKIVSVQTLQQEKVSRGTQLGQLLLPWLFPIGLIVLWQIASSTGLLESRILPAPTAVVTAFWHLLLSAIFQRRFRSLKLPDDLPSLTSFSSMRQGLRFLKNLIEMTPVC